MAELHQAERTIINTLLDRGLFTSSVTSETKRAQETAIEALKRPGIQKRINTYMRDMFGEAPQNFQENLLFLNGTQTLTAVETHVLLATCKAVINAPELQGVTADRVIACTTLTTMVNSEVTELDDKQVRRLISALFVDRFQLFSVDRPVMDTDDESAEVEEYWDVMLDFTNFVQCLVGWLRVDRTTEKLTAIQRVNANLLQYRYLDAKRFPELWTILAANKVEIEASWHELQRFYLECGDDYAVLLDDYRRPSDSRPFYAAVRVARSLGSGLNEVDYNQRIKVIWQQLYPKATLNVTLVKDAVRDAALAYETDGFMVATPLAQRYAVQLDGESDEKW